MEFIGLKERFISNYLKRFNTVKSAHKGKLILRFFLHVLIFSSFLIPIIMIVNHFFWMFIFGLFGGWGIIGDFIPLGLVVLVSGLLYSFSEAILEQRFFSKGDNFSVKAKAKHNFYRLSILAYGFVVFILLYGGSRNVTPMFRSFQLVPFDSIGGTLSLFFQNRLNTNIAVALIAGNLFLFAPLGFFIRPIFKTRRHGFYMSLILFVFLELMQAITLRGVADIDDIILYVGGVFIGFYIYDFWVIFKRKWSKKNNQSYLMKQKVEKS